MKQRQITSPMVGIPVCFCKKQPQLINGQITYHWFSGFSQLNRQNLLALQHTAWFPVLQISEKGMDCGKPLIYASNTVTPFIFEPVDIAGDSLRSQRLDAYFSRRNVQFFPEILKEQFKRVAIGTYGVDTEIFPAGKIGGEVRRQMRQQPGTHHNQEYEQFEILCHNKCSFH